MKALESQTMIGRRYLFMVALLALALYVLLPQLDSFAGSWHLLRRPHPGWLAAAIVANALAYIAAALTYKLLAFKTLDYGRTILVQLAAMFVNRLLPAGIGGLGANYAYLRKQRHSQVQAATVVAINNLWGFLGHLLIIAISLIAASLIGQQVSFKSGTGGSFVKYAAIALPLSVAMLLSLRSRRFARRRAELFKQLAKYRSRRGGLALALASSMSLTILNILCLYCCAQALGAAPAFTVAVIVFSFGIAAGTAVPTPGGLGGFEAGLVAGFVAYDIGTSQALAIALLYRLIAYWCSLLIGAMAFITCQRRRLLFG